MACTACLVCLVAEAEMPIGRVALVPGTLQNLSTLHFLDIYAFSVQWMRHYQLYAIANFYQFFYSNKKTVMQEFKVRVVPEIYFQKLNNSNLFVYSYSSSS